MKSLKLKIVLAALAGLVVPGTTLDDVACTSKTIANFPELWSRMLRTK